MQVFEKVQSVSIKDMWVLNINNWNFNLANAMNFMRNEIYIYIYILYI